MDCLIIGAGIGGLTTALALRRRGLEPHICEAAPELREVGAGIWMPPNAMQVLARLGVSAAVAAAGRSVVRGEIRDRRRGLLQAVDIAAAAKPYGFGTVAIHRGRLQQILAEQLPPHLLELNQACAGLARESGRVRVGFTNGSERDAPVVIGADGLRSVVRQQLFPHARLRYSGQTSYRGVARLRLPDELDGQGWEVWDAGCRFGFSAIGEDEVYWFAVQDARPGETDAPGGARPALQRRFAAFPPPIPDILGGTGDDSITRTDLWDLRPMRSWHLDRVVLVGDAAHATTPNLGQGGAQAIEDAFVLADRLATNPTTPEQAFREYQRIRQPKANWIVKTSWRLGRVAHIRNPLARSLRNSLIRATPARVAEKQFRALFELGF